MIDLSICMVSLNCWDVLEDCLTSLRATTSDVRYEVIMVDNASTDDTVSKTQQQFPDVQIIQNDRNVGFTKATNQAIEASSGRHILWLNTDTILQPDTLVKLCRFMADHPACGIVGPKVLNPDGSFQPQCKRGMPTPTASLSYMLKLDRIWPNNPVIGQYLLTHLSPDQAHQVTAVSGCCLWARRDVWEAIGALDERIFAFGEDIDWCVRAQKAGWEIWYYPASVITHLKGQGGVHVKPYHKIWGMHRGMWVFYQKHLAAQYAPLITAGVWLGVWGSMALASAHVWIKRRVSAYRSARTA